MTDLLTRLENAKEGSRELDALIVAELNDAMVTPYPPRADYGPGNQWQFWSRDGKHFLGNESAPRFKIPHYTTSLDAALTLVPGGDWHWQVRQDPSCYRAAMISGKIPDIKFVRGAAPTPALALCIAALRARSA